MARRVRPSYPKLAPKYKAGAVSECDVQEAEERDGRLNEEPGGETSFGWAEECVDQTQE